MIDVNKIKSVLREKNISNRKISQDIGITEAGFYKIIRSKSTNVDTLLKISDYLKIPIYKLINQGILETEIQLNEDRPVYGDCQERIKELKELVKSKDIIIDLLNEKINGFNKLG